ncbi:hypothetical protein MAR_008371, partial [Mya arenaria]
NRVSKPLKDCVGDSFLRVYESLRSFPSSADTKSVFAISLVKRTHSLFSLAGILLNGLNRGVRVIAQYVPITMRSAWNDEQEECPDLRRVYAHLKQETSILTT